MRHFLKFLPANKRADAERQYAERATAPGAPQKEAAASPSKAEHAPAHKSASNAAERPVSESKPKPRAEAEFGGCIERRTRVNRPAVGQERRADAYDDPRGRLGAASGVAVKRFELGRLDDSNEELGSTGSFLSALDNSAITLADSGIFKTEQEDDQYNPYNKS